MSKRKYRKFSPEFKFHTVLEVIRKENTQAQVARKNDISFQLIDKWKKDFLNNGYIIFEEKKESNDDKRKIEKLENIIGKQTVELKFLKKTLDLSD